MVTNAPVSGVDATVSHVTRSQGGSLRSTRSVTLWLALCTLLVLMMIVVGGYTRLSQSGLSMVDWQPLAGVLPPLGDAQWQAEFERYQAYPEYQQVNSDMTLGGFKRIYLVEYAHRILGRSIGLVFFIPFVLFLLAGKIHRALGWRLGAVFILGGLQGLLGWYMVKSGLVDQPHVSQYRLTAHLSLAVCLYAYLLWLLLKSTVPAVFTKPSTQTDSRPPVLLVTKLATAFVFVTGLMIVTGGFMAGTHAGYIHNTFPKISGEWLPSGLLAIEPLWRNFFENPTTIQVTHRYLALVTWLFGTALGFIVMWRGRRTWRVAAAVLTLILLAQVCLGIITLLGRVPLSSALLHQFGAMCLLSAAVYLSFRTRYY